MSSSTELLYGQQAGSSSFVAPDVLNPRAAPSTNGSMPSNMERISDFSFLDQPLSRFLAPLGPLPPSQGNRPPLLEEANIDNALRLQLPSPQSVTSAPTPSTAIGSLRNLDSFIHTLNEELHHSPNASIICSVKQNDTQRNVHDGFLEQRLEKRMNVQLSVIPPAANQRIKLPVPLGTFASGASEPKPLLLSLVIAGETTRRIFGGVGFYHPNQPRSELLNIFEGSNFSPVVCITPGRTVSIGFRFTTYPRQCDPSEEAFRVVATIHDCDGRLVAYCLSESAYSVKSHPLKTKRSLQASADDSDGVGNSRSKRRRTSSALVTTSTTSIAMNHALPSSSSTAGSSGQQQIGGSADAGGPPMVEPAVDQSRGPLIPIVGPRSQSLLYEQRLSSNPTEGSHPMPTLDEAVPSSCSWRGGIVVSLFVDNIPQDGSIYARFGDTVVKTVRRTPDVLTCKVPAAVGPCEVDVTLSRGSGSSDAPYGRSLCKFIYEEDDITRLVRSVKAEAQDSHSFDWQAATRIQEYASRNRLIPYQSYAYQSTYDPGLWQLASFARIEVVEEDETANDAVHPETSNNVPDLEVTSHGPFVMEGKCGDATGIERGKPLATLVALDDSEDHTTPRTISKPNVFPTPKPKKPVIHNYILNSPPVTQYNQQPCLSLDPDPADQAPPGNARTSQQLLESAPSAHPHPPNLEKSASPTGLWNPTTSPQTLPTAASGSEPLPTSALAYLARGLGRFAPPPIDVLQGTDLNHFCNGPVHASYRNIRLKCLLKYPKFNQQNSGVTLGIDKKVVLEVYLQADGGGRIRNMEWQGIALPRTCSVKQPNQLAPARLLYFSIDVRGSTTGISLTGPCDSCWQRVVGNPHGPPHYLVDFKSDSPFILFPRADTLSYIKAEVTFNFTCYSHHQKQDFELVARLHDEQDNLVAYYQLPYSFKVVTKVNRDGGLQDKRPSTVHPLVLSPAVTTATLESGSSNVSYRTASPRSTVSAFSQLPALSGGQHRTSIRHPVPQIQHPSQWEDVESHTPSFGVGSRKDIQQPEAGDQPLLRKVVPVEGPTRGGLSIVLTGTNLPPWPTVVYARFGSAGAVTSRINQSTLECTLPVSSISGLVDVTLSLSPDHDAPKLGLSLCTFTYRDEQESFPLVLRSVSGQRGELPRVAPDILLLQQASPKDLNQALRRLLQRQGGLPPARDRELEELGVRFLATISGSPYWSNDLSFADENHQTIAHLCVLSSYTRLLTKVVNWRIDLDVRDMSGLTALHCAYLREDWDCVRILKEAGANEYIKDNLGRTPREMCQRVESEGTVYSESEGGRSSSVEEDWPDVHRKSASSENFTLLDAHMMLQPSWRNSSDITPSSGIRASPMPISGPSSEGSFNPNDEPWIQAFRNLQISEPPPPLARPFPLTTSSPSTRGGGPPRYGWSHLIYPPSPSSGVQWSTSSGAPVRFHPLLATSSFDGPAPAFPMPEPAVPFPMPEPAVPSFPVLEPTAYLEEVNHYANHLSQRLSSQWGPPRVVPYLMSEHHTLAQTPPFHAQRLYQAPPSPHCVLPPTPPPPRYVKSEGAVPNLPPPHLSRFEGEKAMIRHQLQEAMRTWPSAEQEKEEQSMKFRDLDLRKAKGTLADAGGKSLQQPKQGED